MGVKRVFQSFFNTEAARKQNSKQTKMIQKTFHEILQEEYNLLMQTVSEAQKNGTPIQLYQKYNPRISDYVI